VPPDILNGPATSVGRVIVENEGEVGDEGEPEEGHQETQEDQAKADNELKRPHQDGEGLQATLNRDIQGGPVNHGVRRTTARGEMGGFLWYYRAGAI